MTRPKGQTVKVTSSHKQLAAKSTLNLGQDLLCIDDVVRGVFQVIRSHIPEIKSMRRIGALWINKI